MDERAVVDAFCTLVYDVRDNDLDDDADRDGGDGGTNGSTIGGATGKINTERVLGMTANSVCVGGTIAPCVD